MCLLLRTAEHQTGWSRRTTECIPDGRVGRWIRERTKERTTSQATTNSPLTRWPLGLGRDADSGPVMTSLLISRQKANLAALDFIDCHLIQLGEEVEVMKSRERSPEVPHQL